MDLVIPQIARLAGVESATRLFLLLSQILIVGGAMALERVVKGRVQVSGFVAVMFLYCLPFAWGFVNFEFGLQGLPISLCGRDAGPEPDARVTGGAESLLPVCPL